MQKLIIGCGYLGGRVADIWMAQGHTVHVLTRSQARAQEFAHRGMKPIVGDLCDPVSLPEFPAMRSVLFAVGYDASSGRTRQQVQVEGLKNITERLVQAEQVIYISSSSVYGQSAGEWVDEMSECQPVQPGGIACLQAEQSLLTSLSQMQTIDRANVLRLSGIYGPDRLLSKVESLRAGQALSGTGLEWLNLIHVDDAAAAVLACELRAQPNQTYLISDDKPVSRAEYYGLLATLVGAPPPRFDPASNPSRGSGGLNKRCCNRRLHEQLQLDLLFPTINSGLPHALSNSAASHSDQ
jgi:nucleoside-diphosphate-sugar epimerase